MKDQTREQRILASGMGLYTDYVELESGTNACIGELMFTYAILADLHEYGYEDRWCYKTYAAAKTALDEWKASGGRGEPQGWHRHPNTGRRREDGDPSKETINW
jgi:hypothetical protein